jgi:hypothetical protein
MLSVYNLQALLYRIPRHGAPPQLFLANTPFLGIYQLCLLASVRLSGKVAYTGAGPTRDEGVCLD